MQFFGRKDTIFVGETEQWSAKQQKFQKQARVGEICLSSRRNL